MASSSSSSPSASTSSSQLWKYDVFLSFRGEDIRHTFADHLYSALEQYGISTYHDDETLPRGQSVSPSIMKAIEESKISIIVFSESYAWCLLELEHIMKCKDMRGKIVIPIFYHVDPSQVRKQKGKFREAFEKHELENKNKVESWRQALVDASNFRGYIVDRHAPESKCIKEVVVRISQMLQQVTSSPNEKLIGIQVRVQDLESKLHIGSGGVKMVGIWGIGGGGKTTLASSVYNRISSNFYGCCFVNDIREESTKNGLETLQENILQGVLKQKQMRVGRVEEGIHMIKSRLNRKKVLIVLDDVDDYKQLQVLAGSPDWFGEGSRIIITTRDARILRVHSVDVIIHSISLLNDDEANNLVCKYAFPDSRPIKDYELLIKDVVSYAGGLPLALKVLAHYLYGKDMSVWRSALAKFKEIPEHNTMDNLRISFDGLEPMQKELFLDIACFFRGEYKDERALMILDACGYYPDIGVEVLIEKALITITEDGRFDMHDLVQEMAHYIVRGENRVDPHDQQGRIWDKAIRATTTMDAEPLKIPLENLCLATDNFSEKCVIAKGGFGSVYKAQYEHGIVALKKLDPRFGQGAHEFNMEITVLSAYRHKNLVSLVGFCNEGDNKILVYKYETNGSLHQHIPKKDLTWLQRLQICLDAAQGLKFLHDGVGTGHRILHCDIKSANILLDENFTAKICDFGLSKIGLANVAHTTLYSRACGTLGYCDPEFAKNDFLTQRSDVYSFGVVMFEVLCSKLVDVSKHPVVPFSAKLVQKHYESGTLDEIIDPDLRNEMNLLSLSTFSAISYQCLKCPGQERPTMSVVVEQLEEALVYQQVFPRNEVFHSKVLLHFSC